VKPHPIDALTRGRFQQAQERTKYGQECATCGLLNCRDTAHGQAAREIDNDDPDEEQSNVVSLTRPKSGKAPPFEIFDKFVPELRLKQYETNILNFLIRETWGRERGLFYGREISMRLIMKHCNLGGAMAFKGLNGLESRGLIRRKKGLVPGKLEFKTSHICVILPGVWEPSAPNVEPDS
jgi:hypothetical protein